MIFTDYPLKNCNTFGIDVRCRCYCTFASDDDVVCLAGKGVFRQQFFVLGGGSNVLFTDNYEGCIVHPDINLIRKIDETSASVLLEAGAGTKWDDFVEHCVQNNYYGVENLSHIPGTVGGAPVQNIGAYGAEAAQTIHSVRYFDVMENAFKIIANAQCKFNYRSSIFKRELKNRAVIVSVTFEVKKNGALQTHYGSLKEELARLGSETTLQTARQAIINSRSSKLPDPALLGNAGSFFKNPVVPNHTAQRLQRINPAIAFHYDGGAAKISAASLIENCGWRGRRQGNVGVHSKQALVLVNYGGASGREILSLAQNITEDVRQRLGIELEYEVCIV